MSGTQTIQVGDKGRVVLPAGLRQRLGLETGSELVVIETPGGIALLTREQLRTRVCNDLAGADLVTDLLAERREAAAAEDVG